jgi:hypothetical protein
LSIEKQASFYALLRAAERHMIMRCIKTLSAVAYLIALRSRLTVVIKELPHFIIIVKLPKRSLKVGA